jgi:hypothetical protein
LALGARFHSLRAGNGERSIDLVGEAQWIVAVILGTGHSGFPRLLFQQM